MTKESKVKIFISYSWSSPKHKEWVMALATRLVNDGIDTIIDEWDLKEGHDLYKFMESMVKSDDINKVLIILDEQYTKKANTRDGGVGTETQIISPEVYNNVTQEKFIPIIAEKDSEGNPFLPTFLKSRVYIDLSEEENFEEKYEQLVRSLYGRPSFSKPKLGTPPKYLFEETPFNSKTSHILKSFDYRISKNRDHIDNITQDFLDTFRENLKDFSIQFANSNAIEVGKAIYENIQSYTPLRDDFLAFFDKVTKSKVDFNVDILVEFLENLNLFRFPLDGRNGGNSFEFDNFRFIIHELFIYLVAIGLKNQNYEFIQDILYSPYFPKGEHDSNKHKSFDCFYQHIDSIDEYYNTLYNRKFYSPMADLMIKRSHKLIDKHLIIQADLLCHYIGTIDDTDSFWIWFPLTYIYGQDTDYEFFYRMISKRHFDKAKRVFDVNSIKELQEKIAIYKEKYRPDYGYSGRYKVPTLHHLIDIEKVATQR